MGGRARSTPVIPQMLLRSSKTSGGEERGGGGSNSSSLSNEEDVLNVVEDVVANEAVMARIAALQKSSTSLIRRVVVQISLALLLIAALCIGTFLITHFFAI